jgi:peptidyl-prolyl cis-trans isomerase A (cyclophilin A)
MSMALPRPLAPLIAVLTLPFLAAACGDSSSRDPGAIVAGPAPDSFRVAFETTRGTFVVEAIRAWAPNGADRFYQLARSGFFDETRFFRVVPGFVAQFGINNEKSLNEQWEKRTLADDPPRVPNARGTIAFTNSGPNTRSHQLFVSLADNPRLDKAGFAPVGRVVEGMAVVDSIYSDYGEDPDQHLIATLGNSYLTRMFPKLDYIKSAKVVGAPAATPH